MNQCQGEGFQPAVDFSQRKGVVVHLTENQVLAALEGRKIREAAKLLGVSQNTLFRRFSHLWDRSRRVDDVPSVCGGKCWINPHGYVMEHSPGHPKAKEGYVLQHRLAMEKHLGRYLEPSEIVHHKDRNKLNNCIDNLQLVDNVEHMKIHATEDRWTEIPLTESQVAEALEGRTTLEAATLLGVNHNTLRNRFDYLLTKRKSPSDPDSPEVEAIIRKYASDPNLGVEDLARDHKIGASFAKKFCEQRGIVWVKKKRYYPKKAIPVPTERDAA